MTARPPAESALRRQGPRVSPSRLLVPTLMFTALVVAAVGSLGAPLITTVATTFHTPLATAQWTLTLTLLSGAVATPVLGRLGSGAQQRSTALATLGVVTLGSLLTVLPLPFGWLLAGRAAQGTGLALTALMMGAAREHLDKERAGATIALISVASTAGIGVGYPLAGLLAEVGGLRAAYGLGLAVTCLALIAVWAFFPRPEAHRLDGPDIPDHPDRAPRKKLDLPGAALLGGGLVALLVPLSATTLWQRHPALATALVAAAAVLLTAWFRWEQRTPAPLVDTALLRHPAVAATNFAMFSGGAGMYLLLTLLTRYVQTPSSTGYGFGVSTFVAGLALTPFSAFGFVAGRALPAVRRRAPARLVLCCAALVVLAACALFALARSDFAETLAAMAILGFGVGAFSAAMPGVILAVTPPSETSSLMSANQVVRSVGFSLGSALGGFFLTSPGGQAVFPADSAYSTAAWTAAAIMALASGVCLALRERKE